MCSMAEKQPENPDYTLCTRLSKGLKTCLIVAIFVAAGANIERLIVSENARQESKEKKL